MATKMEPKDGGQAILAIFVEDLKTPPNEMEPMTTIVLKWRARELPDSDFKESLQFAEDEDWVKLSGNSIAMTNIGFAAALAE